MWGAAGFPPATVVSLVVTARPGATVALPGAGMVVAVVDVVAEVGGQPGAFGTKGAIATWPMTSLKVLTM